MERLTEEELADAMDLAQRALEDDAIHMAGSVRYVTAGHASVMRHREYRLARAILHLHAKLAAASAVVEAAGRLVDANRLHEKGGTNPLKRAADSTVLGRELTKAVDEWRKTLPGEEGK